MDFQKTNLTTNSLNFRATGITSSNRDCGIDISNISSFNPDLGQMSIRGGILELISSTTTNITSTNTNITSSSLNLRANGNTSANRDCGIDISNISSLNSDLGQMSLRGGVINIGNASNASIVNINGIVNMSGANFNILNSFFSQW